ASKDPRIRIHNNQKFVRIIANHNIAFRQVSRESKYCKLIAADDLLFPECLEKMVSVAEEHPRVGIVGSYQLRGTEVDWRGIPYPNTVVPGTIIGRMHLLGGPWVLGTATSVMFRSDIVTSRDSFYNESNLHADDEACVEFLDRCDFGFVHQILTF